MHASHSTHLKMVNKLSPNCFHVGNILFKACHFIVLMRAKIYGILNMFILYLYASKVMKVTHFPSEIFWACLSWPGAAGSEVAAHPSQESQGDCQQSQEPYCSLCELFHEGLQKGIIEKQPKSLCDYITVMSLSLPSSKDLCSSDAMILIKLIKPARSFSSKPFRKSYLLNQPSNIPTPE